MELEVLSEQLKNLGKRVHTLKDNINTEEATKTSLILPFFQILGYDIFNPLEFIPEFTADFGIKKGEKVDYAIKISDNPVILIEAKSISEKLTKHDSQLFRYFGTTTSKFGILTNGQEYKFYTDLDEPNKMDTTPFLTIDITKIKDVQIAEIAKFHKDNFDVDKITSSASELKYLNSLKNHLSKQLTDPDESFVKYIVGEIYEGTKTKNTLEKFEAIVKKGFSQFISERVNEKLSAALNTNVDTKISSTPDTEEVKEEVSNKAKYLHSGFRWKEIKSGTILNKRGDLRFEVQAKRLKDYEIWWQVTNTGKEAENANCLRGDFYSSELIEGKKVRKESTRYAGRHYVEAYLVKNGICYGKSSPFEVNIADDFSLDFLR